MDESCSNKIIKGALGLAAGLFCFFAYRLISNLTALFLNKAGILSSPLVIIIAGSLTVGIIVFVTVFTAGKSLLGKIGLLRIKPLAMVSSILCGASMNVLTVTLISVLPVPEKWVAANEQSVSLLSESCPMWMTLVATYFIAPFAEELIFRGVMYAGTKSGWGVAAACIVTSLIFGIAHGNILQGLYAALAGAVFVIITELTGSLWCSIAAHMAYNAGNILTGLLVGLIGTTGALVMGALFTAGSIVLVITERKTKEVNASDEKQTDC